jgi:DNA polymerase
MENKKQQLLELNTFWESHNTCGLKLSATQAVFGDGNPNAEIVFIGEAPGKDEDIAGKPFVGRSGQFLNEMLGEIKLERGDVYITNIVKYRPPNNRDPLPEEIEVCKDWLHKELNIIKPKVIIFLGRYSMNHFFPDQKISLSHGKLLIKKITGIETNHFFPLYHPAAALYNGLMREVLIKDFKKIPKVLEKVNKEKNII